MSSFRMIINHLSSLSIENRGKAFERYCKWFLENDPCYTAQIKKVWLWDDWSDNWGRDKGIDLIAETYTGEFWAIQAKAYNETNYITKEDVDKFLSESSRKIITFRLLIATTNNIGPNAREVLSAQEKQVGRYLLDNLESSVLDWSLVLENPNKRVKNAPKIPREHQKEAISAVVKNFETASRGQLYMACGTGKTLVGLWIATCLKSQNTLVFVPSISLVAQLYREWSENSGEFSFDPIFVCSDKTVSRYNDDQSYMESSELGFPVTTNANEIIRQYSLNSRPKVIFSTYHSSPIIAQVCSLNASLLFDLIIADEAHRCAGPASSAFATVVDEQAIKAKRRLFMTATPKIFSDHVKQKTQEAAYEIVSMDDGKKFGPVFHTLLFSDAIKQNLLSDYQVIISVMDDAMYREYAENGRFVCFDEHETDARTLACQLLIAKVIKKFELKKVISFHSRKKFAQGFVRTFQKALLLLPDNERPVVSCHETILGEMQQSERRKILNRFDEAPEGAALIANVRCLSEGIDVPALDGIAFVDPKGSEIDIIQAVGRAIRKSPTKKIGTIIIPIFVNLILDERMALEQSCFKPIWKVVRALRSHDDVLAEELDSIRLELGKRTYKNPSKSSKITIDVPIGIGIDFGEVLKVKVIQELIEKCSSSWNYQLNLLKEFRLLYPNRWPRQYEELPKGNKLGRWCSGQRKSYKRGVLEDWKVKTLNAINFPWNSSDGHWLIQFNYLKSFRQLNPNRWPSKNEKFTNDSKLGVWYGSQKHRFKNGLLKAWQIKKLEELGFVGDVFNTKWNKQFNYLVEFRKLNPDLWPVITQEFPIGNPLGNWCADQRENYRKNLLSKARIQMLEDIGFQWYPLIKEWTKQLNYLIEFRKLYPTRWPSINEEFPIKNKLGRWVSMQREAIKKGQLSESQKADLNNLGFIWNTFNSSWNVRFDYLVKFRRLYPTRWPKKGEEFPEGNKISYWCVDQRIKFKKGKLSIDKKSKLDEIGFPWNPRLIEREHEQKKI